MTYSNLKTKDGKEFYGYIWYWRPEENWFSMVIDFEVIRFSFDDVESLITPVDRISITEVGERDEMEKARKDLSDGRKYNWNGIPQEKFGWES